jgi:energy-converting hydrogenase Eha subunit B
MLKELEEKFGIKGAGAIGQAIQTGRSKAGDLAGTYLQLNPFTNVVDDVGKKLGLGSLSSGIAGAIGGIDTGAMKAYGSAIAKRNAIMDLEKKYANYLKGQGFANRANIADTETTRARTQALLDLLSRKG